MNVTAYDSLASFHAAAMPYLMRDEVENCLLVSPGQDATRFCGVFDTDRPLAFAHHTPGGHAFVSTGDAAAAELLVRHILLWDHVAGVVGSTPIARAFKDHWCTLTSSDARLHCALLSHRLDRVQWSPGIAGELAPFSPDDAPVVTQWIRQFSDEINEPTDDAPAMFRLRLEKRRGFVWRVNGQPGGMAGWAGPTPNGVRINLVYTPPENRGRGYASAAVAALSQQMLDSGKKFCFLYTDSDNPTSNSIYRKIGYVRCGEAENYTFIQKG